VTVWLDAAWLANASNAPMAIAESWDFMSLLLE